MCRACARSSFACLTASTDSICASSVIVSGSMLTTTRLDLYSGDDPITLAFLELGGVGVVSVTAHLWGPQIAEMIRRHRDGDVDGARALHEEQRPAYELLRIQTNPIPIKAALNLTGHEVGGHRLPMVEPDEDELAQIRSCLERAGLLAAASA